VDINSVVDKDTMLADGIHPNPDGYKAIAKKFYNAIGEYYGKEETTVDTSNVKVDINDIPSDLTEGEKIETITLNSVNEWKWDSISANVNLDTTVPENGITYQYIYYVKEETTSNKWKVSYQHNGQPANGQMAITVTNTGDEEVKKLPIKVEKKWRVDNIDVTNDATKHPDEVTVQLYSASSENGTFSPVVGTTFTLNKENNWEHTWENVCEEGLYYKVVETKVNGWNANSDIKQITTDSMVENPVTITLTNTPEVGDLQIEKSWLGEANADSVQVELYRVAVDENGTPISNATEQTDNVARAYNFNSESGLLSLSRFKRAVAELETQSAEQETPQAETEETTETTKSSGSLGKMKSTVSARDVGDDGRNFVKIDSPESGERYTIADYCGDKKIDSIEVIFNNDYNSSYFASFRMLITKDYDDYGDSYEGEVENGIYQVIDNDINSITKIGYERWWAATVKEIRFYYTPQGPQISWNAKNETAVVGDTVTLPKPTVSDNNLTVTYLCNGNPIAGNSITFDTAGTFKITAKIEDSTGSATTENAITYTVSDFKITNKPASITEGDEIQISAFSTNVNGEIEWSSSNSNILTYENGKFKAVGSGDVTITATRKDTNITDTITYTVNAKGFSLSADKTTLHVGGTAQLTASESGITWKSSDSSVATVDNTGKVTAQRDGTATITATRGNKDVTIEIEVVTMYISYGGSKHVSSLDISKNINESETINFVGAIGDITGKSEDETVATVNGTTITVTAKEKQSTKVTFTDEAGASIVVNVSINEIKEVDAKLPNSVDKITTVGTNGVITISKDKDWKSDVIENLPLTDGNGHYYQYYIK
ncbi:MAG: Ig-like domain-containing protein, partial [Ruminococcus sp.]|nr:Ig-like domain-containing protein [Ruminococcus sp.]